MCNLKYSLRKTILLYFPHLHLQQLLHKIVAWVEALALLFPPRAITMIPSEIFNVSPTQISLCLSTSTPSLSTPWQILLVFTCLLLAFYCHLRCKSVRNSLPVEIMKKLFLFQLLTSSILSPPVPFSPSRLAFSKMATVTQNNAKQDWHFSYFSAFVLTDSIFRHLCRKKVSSMPLYFLRIIIDTLYIFIAIWNIRYRLNP